MRSVDPPPFLGRAYRDWNWSVAWSYEGAVTTWRLGSPAGDVRDLKVRPVEETPRLVDEAVRLRWAREHLPVPAVVDCGAERDLDWLLLDGLPGRNATAPELKARPA